MTLGPVTRVLATVGLCLLVLVGVMSARAVLEARVASARAQAAMGRGDVDAAIVELRLAARWNAPGNLYASSALETLERVASNADSHGEQARALAAYRAIHAAIHATRGLYTSQAERLERADKHIASLMAKEPPPELEATRSPSQRRDAYLELLRAGRPRVSWVLVAFAGFVAWVVGASAFLLWGVDREGRLIRRIARPSALALALGWIAFALGLRMA